jgi:hypothetical protein
MSENVVTGLYGKFYLTGTPKISEVEGKYKTSGKSKDGYEWTKLQFGIDTGIDGNSNTIFVEFMGGANTVKPNVIKTKDKDKKNIEVAWKDRFEPAVVEAVSDMRKYKFTLTSDDYKDYNVFIAEDDAVKYLLANLSKDQRVVMSGNFKMERYKKNGKYNYSMKYTPTTVRLAKDEDVNKAELKLGFVFGQDSWDEERLATDKKVDVSAFFTTFDKELGEKGENVFIPIRLILNCDKIDLSVPQHKAIFDYYKGCFDVPDGTYLETEWHCQLFRGTQQKEVTMDDLSDEQKTQISLGIASFEQIKRDMQTFGDRLDEIRLIRPSNKFDGGVNGRTDYTIEDFFEPEVDDTPISKDALFGGGDSTGNEDVKAPIDPTALFGA